MKASPDGLDNLVEVAHKLRNGHGLGRNIGIIRSSCAALLFPVRHQKVTLELGIVVPQQSGFACPPPWRRIKAGFDLSTPRNQILWVTPPIIISSIVALLSGMMRPFESLNGAV
jgi:hypothetical protein